MRHPLKNTVYLLLIVGLLLAGCELFSGTATPNNNSDTGYTWARAKALEAVEDEYPGRELFFTSFYSERVDFYGQLDETLQAPYWIFELIDEEFYRYKAYVFQYHTAVIISDYQHPDDYLWGDYTDADLRRWLGISRNVYRTVSGKRDDVSYKVSCYSHSHSDGLAIYLYNRSADRLCRVELDPITGDIGEVDLDI